MPPLKSACCRPSSCYDTAWPSRTCSRTFLCVLLFSVFSSPVQHLSGRWSAFPTLPPAGPSVHLQLQRLLPPPPHPQCLPSPRRIRTCSHSTPAASHHAPPPAGARARPLPPGQEDPGLRGPV